MKNHFEARKSTALGSVELPKRRLRQLGGLLFRHRRAEPAVPNRSLCGAGRDDIYSNVARLQGLRQWNVPSRLAHPSWTRMQRLRLGRDSCTRRFESLSARFAI